MAEGDAHFLCIAYEGASTAVVQIFFRRLSGSYKIDATVRTDSFQSATSSFTISDAPHYIEFDWQASSAPGADNGRLTLWIDGNQQADLTGLDNDTWQIDRVRLGAVSGLDSGTSGTYYFDAFESRRSTYIGQGMLMNHILGKSMPKRGLMKLVAAKQNLAGRYAPLHEEIILDAPTDFL